MTQENQHRPLNPVFSNHAGATEDDQRRDQLLGHAVQQLEEWCGDLTIRSQGIRARMEVFMPAGPAEHAPVTGTIRVRQGGNDLFQLSLSYGFEQAAAEKPVPVLQSVSAVENGKKFNIPPDELPEKLAVWKDKVSTPGHPESGRAPAL